METYKANKAAASEAAASEPTATKQATIVEPTAVVEPTTVEPTTMEKLLADALAKVARLEANAALTSKGDFKIPSGRFAIVRDGQGGYDIAVPIQRVDGNGNLADCRTILLGALLNGIGGPAGTLHRGRAKTHGVRLLTDAECKAIRIQIPGVDRPVSVSLGYLNGSTARGLRKGTIQESAELKIVRELDPTIRTAMLDEATKVKA